MERVDKLLAATGRWSRREAKELCRAGRVRADGVQVRSGEDKLPDTAVLTVDGETVAAEGSVWLLLHKPAGVLSARSDSRQPTVLSLLPERFQRMGLFPVGRLDKDTEGLLLLTNDGTLAHRLLSPRRHVDKVYYVEVDGTLDGEDAAAFAEGMILADGERCLSAGLRPLGENRGEITLREGKYHQIKRMLGQRGKPVTYLKRVAFGPLILDETLGRGEWRCLTRQERTALAEAAGLEENCGEAE